MQAVNNVDVIVTKNSAQEITHKHRLTVLETDVNIEVPEERSGGKGKFGESSRSEQPSSSKVYVVQIEPVEIPSVQILNSLIKCEKNVINVREKTGVSPSCSSPQIESLIILKIEQKKIGNTELVKNGKNSRVETKSILAPKESASTARAKRNVIKTLALVSCGFIICWSGTEVSVYLNDLGLIQLDWSGAFYNFTTVMVFISCCINPVVYCIQYKQFQKGVKYVLRHNRVWIYLVGECKIEPVNTRKLSATHNTSLHKSH